MNILKLIISVKHKELHNFVLHLSGASQPINEGGQSPGAPKVQGAPKCYV